MIDNLLHHGSVQTFSENSPFHMKQFAFRQRSLNGIEGGGANVWLLEHRQTSRSLGVDRIPHTFCVCPQVAQDSAAADLACSHAATFWPSRRTSERMIQKSML